MVDQAKADKDVDKVTDKVKETDLGAGSGAALAQMQQMTQQKIIAPPPMTQVNLFQKLMVSPPPNWFLLILVLQGTSTRDALDAHQAANGDFKATAHLLLRSF